MSVAFVEIDVDPCLASPEGISLRFKRTAAAKSCVAVDVPYESEEGASGTWGARAIDDEADEGRPPMVFEVEDSSDGTAWVVVGGRHGLRLVHRETGAVAHEPYLLLARGTSFG